MSPDVIDGDRMYSGTSPAKLEGESLERNSDSDRRIRY
jgi:hypothetical protein